MEDPLSPESIKLDDKKVETAVKFLQNPKVWQTPYSKKIAFLKNKGLNEEEIQLAIERSGTKEDQIPHDVQQHQGGGNLREPYIVSPGQSVVVHQHRWRDYFGAVVLGGGVVWATAHLIKTYVLPYFNISTEDKKSKELEKAVEELNSGFRQVATEIRDSLQTIQKLLEEQQRLLISINADLTTTKARVNLVPSDVTTLSDIKTEITSLKSLLLGRRQFPPTPFGQPASPSIPAWQRVAVVNKSKGTDDVGEEKREPAGEASSSNLHKSGVKDTAADKADDGLDLSLERRSSHGDNTGDFDEKSNAESDQLDRNLDRTPSQTEREVISSLENSFSSTLNNTENQVD